MPGRRRVAVLHSVFERTFHEQRRALYGWMTGLFAFVLIELAFYPTIRDNSQLTKLYESYPKAIRTLFAVSDLSTGAGYLRVEVFSLIGPLLIITLAILWGGDVVAGEEDRGTIDILLANPLSRRRLVLEKWAALLVGVVLATAGLAAGLAVGIAAVGMDISWSAVGAALVASALLGLLFGTVALALGAATGHRGWRGIAVVLAVVAYLLSSLADLVSWLRPLRPLSPWYHGLGVDPLGSGFQVGHLLVLVAMTAVAVVLAVVAYDRRDLAV